MLYEDIQNWKYLINISENDFLLQATVQNITDDCFDALPANKVLRSLSIFNLDGQYDSSLSERGFYHSTAGSLLNMSLKDISNTKDLPKQIGHKSHPRYFAGFPFPPVS